jgi:hypothetical protein
LVPSPLLAHPHRYLLLEQEPQVVYLALRSPPLAYLEPVSTVSNMATPRSNYRSATAAAAPATTGQGTASPTYVATQERDSAVGGGSTTLHYQSITAMPAYRNFSFEVRYIYQNELARPDQPFRNSEHKTTPQAARMHRPRVLVRPLHLAPRLRPPLHLPGSLVSSPSSSRPQAFSANPLSQQLRPVACLAKTPSSSRKPPMCSDSPRPPLERVCLGNSRISNNPSSSRLGSLVSLQRIPPGLACLASPRSRRVRQTRLVLLIPRPLLALEGFSDRNQRQPAHLVSDSLLTPV